MLFKLSSSLASLTDSAVVLSRVFEVFVTAFENLNIVSFKSLMKSPALSIIKK